MVLEDPLAITLVDDGSDPLEQRFVSLGADADFSRPNPRTERIQRTMKTYNFSKGKRGAVLPLPPGKERITIRLDCDILDYFRDQVERAGGGNYQTVINSVLRDHIEGK